MKVEEVGSEVYEANVGMINRKSRRKKIVVDPELLEYLGAKEKDVLGIKKVRVDGKPWLLLTKAKRRLDLGGGE